MISLFKWFLKVITPPFFFTGLLLLFHLLLIFVFDFNVNYINKIISLITQIFGGFLIVLSINSTLVKIRNKTLFTAFADYLMEPVPFNKKTIIEAEVVFSTSSTVKPKLTFSCNTQTIEENIKYLQEQIDWMKQDFEQEIKEINEKVSQQGTRMKVLNQEAKSILQNMKKIEEFFLDKMSNQLGGVSLIVYGAISGFLA